ncbi:MAG: Na+/H+ antiporter NhaA [Bacteroidales bacterium]
MSLIKSIKPILKSDKAGGIVLIICTAFSLYFTNSIYGDEYLQFWQSKIAGLTVEHWVNDALMAIFFLLIGLELEREIYRGKLSNLKDAILPIFAAFGGMLIPSSIYTIFNFGTPTQPGSGIPTATDIAFALAILALLGSRVPVSLKIFLTALAVVDDLGAIIIIAMFYTKTVLLVNLFIALGIYSLLILLNTLKVKNLTPYLIGGAVMWFFMYSSGVHATITGVMLAFAIPFGNGCKQTPSHKLQHFLHLPIAFIILPVFALANTAIVINTNMEHMLTQNYSLGIALGLIIGKPLGILLLSYIAVKTGIAKLPPGMTWNTILGIGFIAGIGFTMSFFITHLAFDDESTINNSKLIIMISSLVAGIIGFFSLALTLNQSQNKLDQHP